MGIDYVPTAVEATAKRKSADGPGYVAGDAAAGPRAGVALTDASGT